MILACGACGASLSQASSSRTTECLFCGSPNVVERGATAGGPSPTFVLGFTVARAQAQAIVAEHLRSRDPGRGAVVHELHGVYLPVLLYSALARSSWSAQIGEEYWVSHGKSSRRELEWFPLAGNHAMWISDIVVSASRAVPNAELETIEPFELGRIRRYADAVLSGWPAEEPAISHDEAWRLARGEGLGRVGRSLAAILPGDESHDLVHQTAIDREALDFAYVPVWIAAITDRENRTRRVLVNGQTGRVQSPLPLRTDTWPFVVVVGVLALLIALFYFACVA